MKRKLKLTLLAAALLMTMGGHAQRIITEGNKLIIDASALSNITTVKKTRETSGTDTTIGPDVPANLASKTNNKLIYHKFEVTKEILNNLNTTTWMGAFNLCKNLTHNGSTGWRLPTERELGLIAFLFPELREYPGFMIEATGEFHSATEGEDPAYYNRASNITVSLNTGLAQLRQKTSGLSWVRCIRDL